MKVSSAEAKSNHFYGIGMCDSWMYSLSTGERMSEAEFAHPISMAGR
jgi:hypothetical protein